MSSYLTARNYAHLTQLSPTEPGVHGCDARSIDQMIGPSAEPHQGPRPRTGDVSPSSEAMGMLWTTSTHTCRTPRTPSAKAARAPYWVRGAVCRTPYPGARSAVCRTSCPARARPARSAAAGSAGGARRAAERPPRPPKREEEDREALRAPAARSGRPPGRSTIPYHGRQYVALPATLVAAPAGAESMLWRPLSICKRRK